MTPHHTAALQMAQQEFHNAHYANLAACYIDLTQQLAELRKAARDVMQAQHGTVDEWDKSTTAMRKLLEGWE